MTALLAAAQECKQVFQNKWGDQQYPGTMRLACWGCYERAMESMWFYACM